MVDKNSTIIISISLALCSIVEAKPIISIFKRTKFVGEVSLCLLILLLTLYSLIYLVDQTHIAVNNF